MRKRVRQLLAPLRPLPGYDYEHYSRLAGPLTTTRGSGPTRVRYRSLLSMEPHRFRAALLLIAAPVLSLALLVWLLQPAHWLHSPGTWPVMVALLGGIEAARLVMITSNAHAALFARDPVPLVPETGTRVAFLTAFVPGKEPLEMLRNTLTAAVRVRHRGLVHVWLLDEGDDPEARAMCEDLGVHHFSRKGVPRWNQRKGNLRAKTKHGNYNAWLDAHGADYEFIAAVDTDHVPLPNFLERMLGYFRDKDVAFVVGPQVYGNYDNAVTRGAESQQYLFHALIQRAGNRYGSPMLVGTNLTVRRSVLQQIGGFQDSITEDFLTGLRIHQGRNPDTGQRWRSVYTPDVLAVGEGPSSWTDFFTQQMRWSRGTYETLLTAFWKAPFTLSRGTLLNYLFLLSWYPLVSLTWILAGVSLGLYYMQGAGSVTVDPVLWLLLFGNATALQIGLYVWNRRHNVSPHEPAGSSGVAGMAMSAILAPIYAWTLLNALLRRRSRFVVTPKGDSASPDVLGSTFRVHLFWATCLTGLAVYGAFAGRTHPAMLVWTTLTVLVCLAPVLVYVVQSRRLRREWQDRREASRTGTDETRR
ncbi:glycosyltransferase family 2 protein [Streptomyces sp. NPDC004111]|uniref:glycosyltransferase family 2 protein n=1 Tax=Streptomyces sp. NPDC004111 TaxID=3364690 RepID=UPI00368DEDE0